MRKNAFAGRPPCLNHPPAPPSLEVLRQEIDSIDAQMHSLLMQRGDIIDRLIQVKQTQEVGSAFRPAREADMMRRLVQRHRGILPLDTVESIWRVIISTFTYVQAPFSVHADISLGESAMRDSARFHFGFTVPYISHFSAHRRGRGGGQIEGRSGAGLRHFQPHPVVDRAGSRRRAEDHRTAAVRRARRPSGGAAGIRGIARRRQRHGDRSRDVERARLRLECRDRPRAVAAGEIVAVPDTAFDGAALLVSIAGPGTLEKIKSALIEAGASVRSSALVGSHATRYTVPPNGAAKS
jgi:chorismate mutase